MGEAINQALNHWPAERFPSGYRDYWDSVFSGYLERTVADAIDAVRMESDPYVPTCEMVRRVLTEWGVSKPAARSDPSWQDVLNERNRQERKAIEREQKANRDLCNRLSDDDFARIAREHIAMFDKDVRDLPCYSVLKTPAQLRKSNYLTSLVAAHARAHGLVRSPVLEEVL